MSLADHFVVTDTMPITDLPEGKKPPLVRWINSIDLGHFLTMIMMTSALVVQWNAMDRRLTILEEQAKTLNSALNDSRAINRESLSEIKSDMQQVKNSLNSMSTSMAVATYKLEQAGKK